MTSFTDLGVDAHLIAALARLGIDEPFPIQALTVPDALAGRDVCGKAQTGSGKTVAFAIPLVQR
ncbi:MAG: DEAD/DEAH box helicase, partial [Actinomycetota bacterium]|nr:DEAD/DEAH box helicase [Actinomycetota bacterium]